MAPPPSDGSRGCVEMISRPVRGVGYIVPCGRARHLAMSAGAVGWVGWEEQYTAIRLTANLSICCPPPLD
eukprot:COSAG01_NODE_343_length_18564_cov_10.381099_9_plen_70_part_00